VRGRGTAAPMTTHIAHQKANVYDSIVSAIS